MKNMLRLWVALILGFGVCVHTGEGCAGEWKQVMSRGGIDAYSRSVPGKPVLETRGVTIVPAPLEVLAAVLKDIPGHPEWRPSCGEARIVSRKDNWNMTVYDLTDMPWPISDRETVLACEVLVDENTARGVAHNYAIDYPAIPVKKGTVRIRDLYTQYALQYMGPEKTGLVVTLRVDPAGRLPKWLVNKFSKYYLYMQMKALIKMIDVDKYIKAAQGSEEQVMVRRLVGSAEGKKRVFTNRLAEFIKDRDFIDLIVNDKALFVDKFRGGADSGEVGEIILYGWGSSECKKNAVVYLVRALLETRGCPPDVAEKAANDCQLISGILNGEGNATASLLKTIQGCSGTGQT